MVNSYGFNGAIPKGAIAAKYSIYNGEFTGKFYFPQELIPENDENYSVEALYGVSVKDAPALQSRNDNFRGVFLMPEQAISYSDEWAAEYGNKYIVQDLLNNVVIHESSVNNK